MKCHKLRTPEEFRNSILGKSLLEIYQANEDLAISEYNRLTSPEFLEIFGDWIPNDDEKTEIVDISRLDKEGRPAIFPMEHNPSMYYVLDKEKNHLPLEYDGLKNYFDSAEIKNIVKATIFYIVQQNSTEKNYSSFLSNKFHMSSLINKFIEFKTNELTKLRDSYKENSTEYNKYDLLLDNVVALEFHKKELKHLLSKEFKSMGLQYKMTEDAVKLKEIQNENDESDEMDTLEKEGSSREYDVATYEKNTKDFINKELIFLLNFVKTNELEETLNSPTFFSFDEIHKIIQNLVSNKVSTLQEGTVKLTDTYDLAKEEISKLINAKYGRHDLSDLINVLDGLDNEKKTQFTKLILTKNNFLTTEIKEDGSYVILNISDVNSKHKSILESWGVDFKDIFVPRVSVKKTKADGTVVERFKSDVLYKKIAEQKGKIDDYLQAIAKLQNGLTLGTLSDIQITKQLDSVIELTKKSLDELGINVSKQAFMFTLVGYSMEEKPAVILKSLKAILVSEQYMIDDIINRNIKLLGTNKVYDNPLKTQDVFVRMSKHEALFSNDSSENTVRNGDKQYWTFSNFNYLDFKQQVWKQSRLELERLSQLPHSESSTYVKYFLATEIEDEELRLKTSNRRIQTELMSYVFNSIQKEDDLAHSTDNKEIKLVDALQDYLHKVLQAKIAKRSYIKTSAPADKGTGRELGLPVFFDANLTVLDDGDFTISEQVIDVFENYYKSDLKRAVLAYEDIKFVEASKTKKEYFDRRKKLVSYYHIKKNKQGYWTGRDEDYKLVGNAFKSQIFGTLNIPGLKVLNELNEPIYDLNFDLSNDQSQVLREYIKTHLKDLILRDTNFLKEKGIFKTTRGGKKFLKIDTLLYRKYETRKDPALAITADFTVNTLISHIEYSKMYSGDPAYYKDMKDYNKRIPGTYTDGIILRVGINEEDRFFNVAVVDSIETASKFREQLTEDLGEDLYDKMDTTDAQGYITPKRWKFIISRSKGWSPRHEEVYRKLTGINLRPLTDKDKGLVAQSLKGVYFNVSEQGVPTYLKYSQFVLSDVTASSSDMKNILKAMKHNEIDELVFSSGVKAGAFASTKITDKEGNILSTDDIKFNSFKLDNRYYKIQQDLPVKGLKQTQISSQFKKNIFDSMAFNPDRLYEIGDKTYTSDETIREIHKLISMLSDIGLEEFKQKVGYNNDYVITNKSKFIQMIIEELAANNPQENIIEGLEKGLRPSALPQAEKKILSKIFSLLKKKVINVKTNGGGFIQTSSFGFDFNAKDTPHGVKWFIDPSTLKPPMYLRDDKGEYVYNTDANGNKRKVVTSGQILLSQSEFYRLFKTEFREGASMTGKQLLKHIDPRVLKNVIGYRIPNQGLSSSSPLEIVGILPEGHGDAVLAYSEITRQTGSDFDIDKMYLMLPNSEWKPEISKLTYIEYNESIVDSEQKKYAIQNRLLEVYLSVLKHPDNLKAIMSPVDDDFISNNIKVLNPEGSSIIFQDFSGIQQLLNKFSYAGGKAGVGQNANQLVDNSISQILELTLNKRFLGWGHVTNNTETILDREYSVELTDAEKEAYLTLFNLPENTKTEKFLINRAISLILNANVDIARDNYISRGNWNTITTNVGLLLLRAGAHPYQVNALLAQPIIKQYVEKVVNSEGLTSTENSRAAADKLEKEYIEKIIQNNTRSTNPAEYENWIYQNNQGYLTQYSLVDLLNNIKEPTLSEKYLLDQIKLLHIFEDLIESAKPVRNAIMASKSDTEGAFFSITSMLIHRNTVSNMLTNTIKNKIGSVKGIEKKFFRDGFLTFSGSNYVNSVIEMERLLKSNLSYFPMANQYIEDLLNEISFQVRNSLLIDERLGEAVYKSVSTYIKSGFPLFKKYNTPETVDELYKNLSDRTKVLQSQNLENFFLDNLEVKMKDGIEFVGLSDSEKSPGFSNSMVNGWRDLLQSQDESLREYAEELVIFSFFQSGFNYNMNEIFSYIPHEWYIKHKFDKYMYEFELPENNEPFIDAFYKHNWDNTLIVPRITLDSFILGKPIYLEKKGAFYRSDLERTGHIIVSDSSYGFETKQPDGSKIVRYKPYLLNIGKVKTDDANMMLQDTNPVKPKDILYKLVGYLPTGQGVYMPTNKLGNKQHMEYEFGKLRKSSNIEENNLILPTIEKSEEKFEINRESYKIWLEGNHIIPKEEYESLHFEKEEAVDLLDFLNYHAKVDSSNITSEVEKKNNVSPFNIKSDKFNPNSLANRLTNPNWYSKGLMDVEAPYKANASKIKAPHLSPEEALKYDMNLMYSLQVEKFRKNPELIDEINEAGGLDFIKQSSHIVGVKNSRWEGVGMNSNFIKVLAKSYETVAKELNKFKSEEISNTNTPNFNTLPNKSIIPTMTYAGIGSRETPENVQLEMTELAKMLEEKGYTLRSGGAKGADSAFESGVKSKKEIFKGSKKTGNKELQIAREIHPNPNALDNSKNPDFVWNLMARNTNQIFGEDLNTPVDFVIAWTQDGLDETKKRSLKSGGTGQAIDMASRKGIPVVNLANPNWKIKLDNILEGKNPSNTPGKQLSLFDDEVHYQSSQSRKAFNEDLHKKIEDTLIRLYPEIKLEYSNIPLGIKNDNVFNQNVQLEKEVNYRLKAVDILLSNEAIKVFTKGNKNNWSLDKILTELQISKEQKQLILDLGITDREQIALELASKYSYTVEINTAKTANKFNTKVDEYGDDLRDSFDDEENSFYYNGYLYEKDTKHIPFGFARFKDNNWQSISSTSYWDALEQKEKEGETSPTQHYSNLTVPGGTNYTEQEIATPAITPSIKGHAQFSTDNGIGWFRSDDKVDGTSLGLTSAQLANMPEEDIAKFTKSTKTRRILEVQSDLFQKGRLKEDLILSQDEDNVYNAKKEDSTREEFWIAKEKGKQVSLYNNTFYEYNGYYYDFLSFSDKYYKIEKNSKIDTSENQFLQLLNKDNNWVTFFVKSIIQDSAKKGYEKVLFPSGNTAGQIENFIQKVPKYDYQKITSLEKSIENTKKEPFKKSIQTRNFEEGNKKVIILDFKDGTEIIVRGNSKEEAEKNFENNLDIYLEKNNQIINRFETELSRLKNVVNSPNYNPYEFSVIEGIDQDKARSVVGFYEKTVINILNKTYGKNNVKQITDEYGNPWNEISIDNSRDLQNILLQKNEADKIIGQANIKALSVLIDAVNQNQDTLPHEYAHHYIAWFRNTPIVQEGIKKWGSEEALVQSIGEQVVKQKGDAYNWWNNFVKWIMNQFNSLSSLKKEQLTQILTDAFLTRQDLEINLEDIVNDELRKLTSDLNNIENQEDDFNCNMQ